MNGTNQISTSAFHASYGIVFFCITTFVLAALIRTKLAPAIQAGARKVGSTGIASKLSFIGTVARFVGNFAKFWAEVFAGSLFAASGMAAALTPLASLLKYGVNLVGRLVAWGFGLGGVHMSAATGTGGTMVIVGLVLFIVLVTTALHGNLHTGEADMLLFWAPMLFRISPGDAGTWAIEAFNWFGQHVGPFIPNLF